jgi:hypothetical protein
MLRLILLSVISMFLISCGGNLEENQRKLDEVYGVCDNPTRALTARQYNLCLAKEAANEESVFNLTNDFSRLMRGGNDNIVYQFSVNEHLWAAALETTQEFPLKIADNQGGILETEWIYNESNQRCLIKIRITSQELISNGVVTNFICEINTNDTWIKDTNSYIDEEKKLTLKVLKTATELKNSSS